MRDIEIETGKNVKDNAAPEDNYRFFGAGHITTILGYGDLPAERSS